MQEEETEVEKPENARSGRRWGQLGKQQSIQLMQVGARKPETEI